MPSMRRSASTPTLSGAQEPLEVYVAMRALACKLPHVPEAIQNGILRDIGCAHYYTVIRSPMDGTLRALDFGPVGGRDIAFKQRGGLWSWARKRARGAPPPPMGTPGEVREMLLTELPDSCMFVGRTNLSLGDIRSYNALQNNLYVLHKSDCRHYVNNLVQYACGVQSITRQATREIYTVRKKALAWTDRLVLFSHNLTDVGQWPRVQRATQTALAVFAALGGRRTAAKLGIRLPLPPVTRAIPARIAAPPAAAMAHSTALARVAASAGRQPRLYKPVLAAAAGSYAVEASLLSSLGDTIRGYSANIGSSCQRVAGRAGQATAGSLTRCTSSLATAAAVAGLRPGSARQPVAKLAQRAPQPRLLPRVRRSQERQTGLLVTTTC